MPPPYIGCVGPAPPTALVAEAGFPVSIDARELVKDVQWLAMLVSQASELLQGHWTYSSNGVAMDRLVRSYDRFLFVVAKHGLFAPPVPIDLIWHAHQSTPQLYRAETQRMLGCHLLHDPWPAARWTMDADGKMQPRQGAVPTTALSPQEEGTFAELECLWKTEFGTDMMQEHEMEYAYNYGW